MNKTAIKNFSIWARNKLIDDIRYRAGLLGITEDGIQSALPQSTRDTEFYDIGTAVPYSISGEAVGQRRKLVEAIRKKERNSGYQTAYKYIVEEVAYTWFNRLIAIRFMEVNDYLPSRIRVLSSDSGKLEPDLVTTPFDAELSFSPDEEQTVMRLKRDNQIDELFRLLFIKQCNALNKILPGLFEKTNDYTELLLSVSVVDRDGVVYHLIHDIDEKDFDVSALDENGVPTGQVEIIGWLYQYYNTEPKNAVFSRPSGTKIKKEEIPAATQLFTPVWIVHYMVENSLGRLWVEGHPDEDLKAGWKYYLEEARQEPEVQARLAEIRKEYAALNPEDIKCIDPCMGSGHILCYLFDVLMQIYESCGYAQRDAAQSILRNNLYGLDIDDRAYQFAYFAVMMKARQYDRRILTRGIEPHVCAVCESNEYNSHTVDYFANDTPALKAAMGSILTEMHGAKEYGSLLSITPVDFEALYRRFDEVFDDISIYREPVLKELLPLVRAAEVLAQKYHVVATNPPYMAITNSERYMFEYVKAQKFSTAVDLYGVFIERCNQLTRENCFQAMITQHSWMYLSSFEKLRKMICDNMIVNMTHLGPKAFDEISGEVVQTTSFVFCKHKLSEYKSIFVRLVDENTQIAKEQVFLSGNNRYVSSQNMYDRINGSPILYWLSINAVENFDKGISIDNLGIFTGQQNITANNEKYLRFFWEVDFQKIGKDEPWIFYIKGGTFRKWYGNIALVVDWTENAKRYYSVNPNGKLLPDEYCFQEGITYTEISSGANSFRYLPPIGAFDKKGPSIIRVNHLYYCLGFFNSKVAAYYFAAINPTISLQIRDVKTVPILIDYSLEEPVSKSVNNSIQICRTDWDAFETSWDFTRHPLLPSHDSEVYRSWDHGGKIYSHEDLENIPYSYLLELAYRSWELKCEKRFQQLKSNEEELNRIFIDIYGLQDELTPDVEDKDVTVRRADLGRDIRSLLSYAVGCMFGRYSLDTDGLAYAGGEWDASRYVTFQPDKDGILPITDEDYLDDDIITLLCVWLKQVYGADTLEENLDFIAKALGGKGNTSREIIRNYFLKGFFADHCKVYQKRPIYWLFDSGKQNGFKALIYLHRYTPDTIGNVRIDYLHRMQRVYENEIDRMQDMIDHSKNPREVAASTKRKEKLQKQLKECREYDEKISHLALSRIELDLDDGVKVNYRKVQTASDGKFYEVLADSKNIMGKK